MDLEIKTILGSVAVIMTVVAHIPYLLQTLRGTNKPHLFTWIIWSLLTFIAFAAQVSGNAGPGAWVTGATGIICVIITLAAWKNADKDITRSDWVMFVAGLSAIPAWLLTKDPLLAVIIVVVIDLCAVVPTIRKSWNKPHEENSFMYGFNIPRHGIALLSLQTVTWVTALYPAALFVMNVGMYAMLKLRGRLIF